MVNETASYFENVASNLGLSIKIPRPSKRMKATSIAINGLVGISFFALGVSLRKVPLALIGVLGIAGAALLSLDD